MPLAWAGAGSAGRVPAARVCWYQGAMDSDLHGELLRALALSQARKWVKTERTLQAWGWLGSELSAPGQTPRTRHCCAAGGARAGFPGMVGSSLNCCPGPNQIPVTSSLCGCESVRSWLGRKNPLNPQRLSVTRTEAFLAAQFTCHRRVPSRYSWFPLLQAKALPCCPLPPDLLFC